MVTETTYGQISILGGIFLPVSYMYVNAGGRYQSAVCARPTVIFPAKVLMTPLTKSYCLVTELQRCMQLA